MTRLVLFMIRCFALAFSFALSTLAAAIFIIFALFLGGDAAWLHDDPAVVLASITFTAGIWLVAAQTTFLPFVGIALVTELSRHKSLMTYVLSGGLCALIFLVFTNTEIGLQSDLPYSDRELWLATLAAGFIGGFTHWLIAGHRAGLWLGPGEH